MLTYAPSTARKLSSDCECQVHTKRSLRIPRSSIGSIRPDREEYDEANDWTLQSSGGCAQTDCSRVPCHGRCACTYWNYTVCYSFRPRAICGCHCEFVCRWLVCWRSLTTLLAILQNWEGFPRYNEKMEFWRWPSKSWCIQITQISRFNGSASSERSFLLQSLCLHVITSFPGSRSYMAR